MDSDRRKHVLGCWEIGVSKLGYDSVFIIDGVGADAQRCYARGTKDIMDD
jgi:hypothetical protein